MLLTIHSVSENVLVDLTVDSDAKAPSAWRWCRKSSITRSAARFCTWISTKFPRPKRSRCTVPLETSGRSGRASRTGGGTRAGTHSLQAQGPLFARKDLPEQIVVDVSALEIGNGSHPPRRHQGARAVLKSWATSISPSFAVSAPRAEEEVAATAVPGAADVEMTKEKKEDGTEGAAPAKGAPAAKGDAKAPAADATRRPKPSPKRRRPEKKK